MQKATGWTKKEFIPCDFCLTNGRKFVCQANKYSINLKKGRRNYCEACAAPVIAMNPKKRMTVEEKQKEQEDYEYMQSRDWYNNSSARYYI
jgi:hypothetical protein